MNKITARKPRIARENGRIPTVLSGDRRLQTFSEALRDSIRQNRSAIEKLSTR